MKQTLSRVILTLVVGMSCFVQASPAQAQVGAAATISIIDSSNFPDIRAYVAVQRSDKTGVPNLSKTDFQLLENGNVVPVTEVVPEDIGLQIAVVIDSTRIFASQDASANKLINLVRDTATNFAIGDKTKNIRPLMKDGLDTLSVFATEGVVIQSSNIGGEINNALVAYQSKFQDQTQVSALMRQAIDAVKVDPPGRVPRKHIVIFSNGLPAANYQDITDTLTKSGVRGSLLVHTVWVSYDGNGGKLTPEAENLQRLSNATGGLFRQLHFANVATATQGLWETIASQRPQYRFTYRSRVTQSGQQSLQVILNFDGTVKSEPTPFSVTVLPPTVTFSLPDVPADRPEIIRKAPSTFSTDTAAFEPRDQKVLVQIKYPDNTKRSIAKVRLLIDGTIVEEKTSPPFDAFSWNISKYGQTSAHTVQVVAIDELGLEAKSDVENILITVALPFVGNVAPWIVLITLIGIGGLTFVALIATVVVYLRRPTVITNVVSDAGRRVKEITEPFIPTPGRSFSKTGKAYLEVIEGFDEPKPPIELVGDNLKLGRDETLVQVILNDRSVSRLHARITEESDSVFLIHDEGSTSGTWVNYAQVPLAGQRLSHGDVINLGRIQLRFNLRPLASSSHSHPTPLARPKPAPVAPATNYSTEPFDPKSVAPPQPPKSNVETTTPGANLAPKRSMEEEHKTEAFTPPAWMQAKPKDESSPPTDSGSPQ